MHISVIIPVYNEEENIPKLYPKVKRELDSLGKTYELIFIDDGSTDSTVKHLQQICNDDANVRLIKLRKNFGKSIALDVGFQNSKGDVIITMDGDLQDAPTEIPRFLKKIGEGYDFVNGWRYPRKDGYAKSIPSNIFNFLTRKLTGLNLHDFNCGFKAFRKKVIRNIHLYGEMHRYIPIIVNQYGYKISEIKVKHLPRKFGDSKFRVSRIPKGFLDLITIKFLTSFSSSPLYIFGVGGVMLFGIGFMLGSYVLYTKYILKELLGAGRPIVILTALFIIAGLQLLSMGLIAEMLVRKDVGERITNQMIQKYLDEE